eukprot:GHVL01010197.1.p1 GENE.GHVL01010197.1~~GHVL01010197.1.p1  ORF type:complete len:454 (-),score=104.86 GHVL01010197.1:974-2335(-)
MKKERLMIREMTLENFKSYGGKRSIGPFHHNLSSIIGPNGSGKSNIIDSLLFVFGRNAKQIRQNKAAQLIHNSVDFPNCKSARVAVYFQNIIDEDDGSYSVVANSELVVMREVLKSGTLNYYLNNKAVSKKQVTEVLKERGIDLDHNRFLILQGEVEQIAMMKPKAVNEGECGLLEYLEDIIDTASYKSLIEEASKERDEAAEQRSNHKKRVIVVENDLAELEAPRLEAEAYLSEERQLLECRSILTQLSRKRHKMNDQELKRQHEEAVKEMDIFMKEKYEKQQECSKAEDILKEKENFVKKKQAELNSVVVKMKELEAEDDALRQEIASVVQKQKKHAADAKRLVKESQQSRKEAENKEAELPSKEKQVIEAEAALETLREKLISQRQKQGDKNKETSLELEKEEENLKKPAHELQEIEQKCQIAQKLIVWRKKKKLQRMSYNGSIPSRKNG